MRGFLYKDLVLSRTTLIIISAFTALCGLGCFLSAYTVDGAAMRGIMTFAAFFLSGMLNMGFFAFDERRVWQNFAFACPSSFRGQTASKYILIFLINTALLLVFSVEGLFLPTESGEANNITAAFTMPVVFFSIQIILNAIELPFLSRFGSQKGVNIKFVFIGVILFFIGVYVLFGDISFLLEEGFIEGIIKFFASGKANLIVVFLPIAAFVLYFLSYFISTAVFRKGMENYEE